ncbi:helix-turn-helix domain-containing protein [Sphingobacterium sp. IITKGP-BTPF85]|nr:AraC family transcriptional regulator [Sphingobacterium sp. IITKGP-BTPF85]
MEKIKTAKGLIESNLSQNFTISQLARIVGTNEQYLKKHFKQFYGMTVFNFIVDCKMNKAKLMLKEKDVKVSSISQQLGYRHATHFTTAFKKFFGYTPNALRYLFAVFIDNYLAIKDFAMIYI